MTSKISVRLAGGMAPVALVLLVGLAHGATALGAQSTLSLDRSNGSYAGTVWLVASSPEAEDPFVGVGLARLPETPLEQAFVVRGAGDGGSAGSAAGREELVGAGRLVVEVKVGPRAHDEVRHLVALWEQGEQADLPAPQRIENLLDRVARALGLKAPYRSVLSGSDPVAYLRDLARINGQG